MSTSCKTDTPLGKAEPIRDGSNTSAITNLRREKVIAQKKVAARGVRLCERNNSADTKVSEERGGGGVPGTGVEIPLQPVVQVMVKQAVPLQSMEVHGGAEIHLQPTEDPRSKQVDGRRKL
ncbi:protein pxr1-like [Pitangus sulphuratus]|nr:protein pxr1-like [Pitangus sulphuratus]